MKLANLDIEKKDVFFTVIMTVIIVFLSLAICRSQQQRAGAKRGGEPVGLVKYKYHQVLRKYSDRMVWEGVSPETDVYLYDSILTKEKSDATISLRSGLQLDIDPNTMVEIDLVGDNASIALKQGTVHANGTQDKNAVITAADGSKIDISDSNASISSGENGLDVTVKSGKVQLSKDGKSTKISTGEVYSVDKTGKSSTRKVSIALGQPEDSAVIVQSSATKPVTFSWTGKDNNYKLHVTKDGTATKVFTVPGQKAMIPLEEGSYSWQVKSSQGDEISLPYFFKVRKGKQLQIISPRNNEKVKSDKTGTVTFSWKDDGTETPVEFELAEDKTMSKVISKKVTSQNSVTVPNLKKGKYYWRARKKHGDKTISDSTTSTEAQEFDVVDKSTETETPPGTNETTEKPEEKQPDLKAQARKVNLSPNAPSKIELEPYEKEASAVMRWSKGGPDIRYRFQMSDSATFKKSITASRTSADSIPVKGLKPGKYFWRVQIYDTKYAKLLGETASKSLLVTRKPLPKPPKVTSVIADE